MFTVCRFLWKYGHEGDPIDVTYKTFETFEKALKYGQRYAFGLKYINFEIEDENENVIYEESAEGFWSVVVNGKRFNHYWDASERVVDVEFNGLTEWKE